jgi:protein phosphatase
MSDPAPRPLEPEAIERMDAREIDSLLVRLDPQISLESALVRVAPAGVQEVAAVGDTHGDWRSAERALKWFLDSPNDRGFVGLGDYVDRAPPDCPAGSAINALYLLSVKAAYPDRVFLIRGNHEAPRQIPFVPHDLPGEMAARWGNDRQRYSRLIGLLERGPLAGYTPSGVFLAHGGFPLRVPSPWTERFRHVDETLLVELLWNRMEEADAEPGLLPPFNEPMLDDFRRAAGLNVFVRGHDPGVLGRPMYHGHCLTLHTSRIYARFGGVLAARFSLTTPVRSTADIELIRLPETIARPAGGGPRRNPAPPHEGRPLTERSGTPPTDGS